MNETVDPEAAKLAAAPAPPQARPPRRFGRILIVVVLAVLAVVAWQRIENIAPSTADATRKAPSGPPPQTVRAATAIVGDMPITLNGLGTVTPYETVTVYSQIAGVLQEVGFEEGQMVKKGDFLAQIDPRPYQAALALAQAQLTKDQALLAQAQSDLERYQTLEKQDSIARQQVADQQFLVTQDKASVLSDQAQIQTAQLNLSYTRIVSPINGRIGLRLVDPGNLVQPSNSSGLFVLTQIDPISVVFSVPEDNIPRIAARLNSGAKLAVAAFDRANVDKLATGTLTTFDNQIDVTTGTIKMRANFDNPKGALFPNQFVNVQLLIDTETGVVLAPNPAIQIGASGSFVYAIGADSKVSKQDVVTGPTDGKRTAVVSGLQAGESLVIDGADRLRDGSAVTIVDNSGAGAPAGGQGEGQRRKGQGVAADGAGASDPQGGRRHERQGGAPGDGSAAAKGAQP